MTEGIGQEIHKLTLWQAIGIITEARMRRVSSLGVTLAAADKLILPQKPKLHIRQNMEC